MGCVFRSEAAEVAEYHAGVVGRLQAFNEAVSAFEARFPTYRCKVRNWGFLRDVYGLQQRDKDGVIEARNRSKPPGACWRWDWNVWGYLPDRRFATGKALWAEMNALRWVPTPPPGLPEEVLDEGRSRLCRGSLEPLSDAFWSLWNVDSSLVLKADGFNSTLWQPALMSEYWAAKEVSP